LQLPVDFPDDNRLPKNDFFLAIIFCSVLLLIISQLIFPNLVELLFYVLVVILPTILDILSQFRSRYHRTFRNNRRYNLVPLYLAPFCLSLTT
jgi:hypothetical protein